MISKSPLSNLRSALAQGLALSALSACASDPVFKLEEATGSGGATTGKDDGSGGGASHHSGSTSGGTSTESGSSFGGALSPFADAVGMGGYAMGGDHGLSCSLMGRPDPLPGYWSAEIEDCCVAQYCRPVDETGQCPAASSLGFSVPVSQCLGDCGKPQGPFAPNEDFSMSGEGECCYALFHGVEDICVEGRPLRTSDAVVVASVVVRSDWMMS